MNASGDTMTGALVHPLGAAATPSLTFTGDLNTGIYSPGADQVAISTNGTGRLFVASDGNVGIGGVAAGAFRLDVIGSNIATRQSTAGDQGILVLKGNAGTTAGATIESSFSAGGYGPLIFITNNSEVARFTQTGRLGLGTSSPDALLTVNGVGAFGAGTAALPSIARSSDLDTGAWFPAANTIAASTAGVERLRIDSTGNVGIGTTSPNAPLCVNGLPPQAGIISAVAASGGRSLALSDNLNCSLYVTHLAGGALIGTDSGNAIRFATNGFGSSDEKARIDGSGRLLVGTSSDSGGALFQVNGNRIRIATANTPASAGATGTTGEIAWDANYIYVCTATNTWKRTAISTW